MKINDTKIQNNLCHFFGKKTSITLAILHLACFSFAAQRTWTGGTSTDWSTASNWSGSTAPLASDSVTISSGTYNCILDANHTVKQLTVSDSLDLNGYTLTVTYNSTFNSGSYVSNGTLTIYESTTGSTSTFTSGTIAATLNVTASAIKFSGTTFTSSVTAVKKGSSSSTGNGGSTFSSTVILIDSSTANWTFANTTADTWSNRVEVKEASSGTIFFANTASGNSFSKSVTFTNTSSGTIHCDQSGSSTFHDSIIVNATGTGSIKFGASGGITTIDTSIIYIGAAGFNITSGSNKGLYLRGIVQNDATKSINLTLTGVAELYLESGCVFQGSFTASAPTIRLNGSRFLNTTSLTFTNSSSSGFASLGGSYYGGNTTITKSGSNGTWTLAGTTADTLASGKTLLIQNTNGGALTLDNGVFYGKVTLRNQISGSSKFNVNGCSFSDSLTLENTSASGGFHMGPISGSAILESHSQLYVPSTFVGYLKLTNITQNGSNTVSFPFQSNSEILYFNSGNTFNGPVVVNAIRVQLNGSTFNNSFYLKRTGASIDTCMGGNIFNGTTTIIDSNSAVHSFSLGRTYADDFNSNVTFKQYGTSGKLYPSYTKNSTFAGDITVDGSGIIEFGANGGRAIFDGAKPQTLYKAGSYVPSFKKIEINSTNGSMTLNYPLSLSDTLFLVSGILITDTTNLLTVPDSVVISGGADSTYVYGPVKKIGNDPFTFPLGDTTLHSGSYHPLSILAPSKITAAYTAQYFAQGQTLGSAKVDSIGYISACEYWTLNRTADTCQVTPSLSWNSNSCNIDTSLQRIAYWNSTQWESLGKGIISGTPIKGSMWTGGPVSQFGTFTLAQLCNVIVDITSAKGGTICTGVTDTIIATPSGASSYQFYKNGVSVQTGSSDKYISSTLANGDVIKVKVSNIGSCYSFDSLTMTVNNLPTVSLSIDSTAFCKSQTHTLTASGTGLTSYSWSTGATTASINVSTAGTYIVNASNGSCIGTNSQMITIYDTVPPVITVIGNPTICTGVTTTDLQAGIPGSNSNYPAQNYLWSTAETTSIITVEDSAIYKVTVLDGHGCYVHAWQTITQADPPAIPIVTPSGTVYLCTEDSGVTVSPITLHVDNYDSDLLWSSSETTQDLEIDYEDNFLVTYTDSISGCYSSSEIISSIINTSSIAPDSITTDKPGNEVCPGDSITLTLYGGYLGGPLYAGVVDSTYWAWYSEENIDSLIGVGTSISVHTIQDTKYYLRGVGPCPTTFDSIIVKCMSVAMSAKNETCPGKSDGNTAVSVSGGTEPFSYVWSPRMGGSTKLWDLAPGFYSILVSDSIGCSIIDSIEVNSAVPIELNISTTNSSCSEASGTAKITAEGGTGIFSYFWTNKGQKKDSIGGLTAGIYDVIVSDSKGCSIDTSIGISDSDGPEIIIDSLVNVSCYGNNDGVFTLSTIGIGGPVIEYPCGIPPGIMPAGSYPVMISDSNGCKSVTIATITEPQPILLSLTTTQSICGDSTGSASVLASGGSGIYMYHWSSGGEGNVELNLPSGLDTVFVTDENGCTAFDVAAITDTNSFTITISKSDVNCFGDSSGTASLHLSGGSSPFHFEWSNELPDTSFVSNLIQGLYSVIVVDSNGCKQNAEVSIISPELIVTNPLISKATTDSTTDGSIELITKGGIPEYTYFWNHDSSTHNSLQSIGFGDYSVVVTDANGCSNPMSIGVPNPLPTTYTPWTCDAALGATYCITTGAGPCGGIFPCTINVTDSYFHDPVDGTDYQCTFEKVNDYVNRFCFTGSGNAITVYIPAGSYVVGRQDHPSNNILYLQGHNVICLENCSNVTIKGDVNIDGIPTTKLNFRNCLKFGTFNDLTGQRFLSDGTCPTNWYKAAYIGNMINIMNCEDIIIENLEINGNVDAMSLGGYFSDITSGGVPLPFSGIQAANSNKISIANINCHHLGSDGIIIEDTRLGPQQDMEISIVNSKFNYNCRNGISWLGGLGVTMQYCEANLNSLGSYESQPGAGLDIEFEGGNQEVANGHFIGCEFKYNRNFGIISNDGNNTQNGDLDPLAHDFYFDGCTFVGSQQGYTAWPNARNFNFNCCDFHGVTIHAYDASVRDIFLNRTKFKNCSFSEEYDDGVHNNSFNLDAKCSDCTNLGVTEPHDYLIDFLSGYYGPTCGGVTFQNCDFNINYNLKFFNLVGAGINQGSLNDYHAVLDNCKFRNYGLNCPCGWDCNHTTYGPYDYTIGIGYNIYMLYTYLYTPIWVRNGPGVYYADGNGYGFHPSVVSLTKLPPNNQDDAWQNYPGNWFSWPVSYQLAYSSCHDGKYMNPVPDFRWLMVSPSGCLDLDEYCIDASCTTYQPCLCAFPNDPACYTDARISDSEPNLLEENNSTTNINVYPNPVLDIIYVKNLNPGEEIIFKNIVGEIVFRIQSNTSTTQLNLESLSPGIYYIETRNHPSKKIIKF